MGQPQETPGASAHGEARLSLYLDGQSDQVQMSVMSAWYTADGECREASLQLSGDTADGWDLINEASLWVWKRWKKPIASHGPFGES